MPFGPIVSDLRCHRIACLVLLVEYLLAGMIRIILILALKLSKMAQNRYKMDTHVQSVPRLHTLTRPHGYSYDE